MASPTSGTAIEPEAPDEPEEALEASESEATEVSTVEARSRERASPELESTEVKSPAEDEDVEVDDEDHWIGVELVDDKGKAVPGEAYRVKLPDGTIQTGRLDQEGKAKIEGITESGQADISFPDIHGDEWRPV